MKPDPPTPFPDLNAVLAEWVAGLRVALADNLCGAYLIGSFAMGDFDERSDVDFLVVTHRDLTREEEEALRSLHVEIFGLPVVWAQRLDGSYAPKAVLYHVDRNRKPFFHIESGTATLSWSGHRNKPVIREVLREHGIVLAGPPGGEVVAQVDPDELRAAARAAMWDRALRARELAARWRLGVAPGFSPGAQQYFVLSLCKCLHRVETGTVVRTRDAAEWAIGKLDPESQDLVRAALAERPDVLSRWSGAASRQAVHETLAFSESMLRLAHLRPPTLWHKASVRHRIRREVERSHRSGAWRRILAGEARAARLDLVRSIRVCPSSPRAWAALGLSLCPPLARWVARGRV